VRKTNKEPQVIAIDAMGGDFAPEAVLEGSLRYVKATCTPVCLFGPQDELRRVLDQLDSGWEQYPISIMNAPQIISMGQEPVQAVRLMPDSSLVRAVASVRDGDCRVALSAGNSGAMMAAALFLIGRNKGVERPALVGLLPGASGATVCLDLGANADCKANNLYQFAHLGVQYAQDFLDRDRDDITVGLLSNGEEPGKGSLVTKEAFALLQKSFLNFVGNVEPQHVLAGKVDVVVSDGFAGNVLLKTFEATVWLCGKKKEHSFGKSGGALLLGVKKPVVIVHGNASVSDIEKAIRFAQKISLVNVESYTIEPMVPNR